MSLHANIDGRFCQAGQHPDWIMDVCFSYFDNDFNAGVEACQQMMRPYGPLPAATESNVQSAFRRLLELAWTWHIIYENTRRLQPPCVGTAVATTVEIKRAVQAAKALGAKEEEIEKPDDASAEEGMQQLILVAFV